MALFDPIRAGSSGVSTGYQIDRSLRMDGTNGYLTRTPTATGNRKIWTWSGWVKRSKLFNQDYIFSCNAQSGNDGIAAIYWKSGNNRLQFYFDTSGANPYGDVNSREYRDVSSWYHIVWQVDASNTTHRIWVNGVEENITGGQPPNYDYAMNRSGYVQAMGTQGWDGHTYRGDMYFAECHYSDGYKYEASDFGEINSETGVWSPKEVNISYGTNGFYLKFDDNSNNTAATIGKDSSGNGNNWTPTGISVSSGDGNDSKTDTPTNNKATLNAITGFTYNATLKEGGLKMTGSSGFKEISTVAVAGTSKFYYEVVNTSAAGWQLVGIFYDQPNNPSNALTNGSIWGFASTQATYFGGSYTSTSTVPGWSNNDVVGIKYENGTLKLYKNGTLATANATGIPTDSIIFAYIANDNTNAEAYVRFNSDDWTQNSAAGVDATWELSPANLPAPTIKLPNKHFDTKLWTGNGGTQNITGINFSPDFVWIKIRSQAYNHVLWDSVRGATLRVQANKTNAEATNTNGLTAFNSDGYTLGDMNNVNLNNNTFVGWNWNAGESTVSNSDGTRTSNVRANPTAGISIVTYTGNGSSGATVGHGLGVAPQVIIMKTRTSNDHWAIYHHKIGNTKIVYMNIINAPATSSAYWNNTTPSSSVFTVGNDNKTNKSGDNYVAYCFHEVKFFSKFGIYKGNGNSDGTFIYTGFRPAFFMFRQVTYSDNWYMYDNKRDTFNPTDQELNPSNSQTEASSHDIDFLSNGVKMRTNNSSWNYNNYNYIYLAFAESPFQNARAK